MDDKGRRRRLRETEPIEKGFFVCSDERVDLATITETLPGIFQTWSNIGCKFNLEKWLDLQNSIHGFYGYAKRKGKQIIFFVVDHFSRSDNRRFGCRGHGCNLKEVRASSKGLKGQLERAYVNYMEVFVVHLSVETDEGAIVFHSDGGGDLDLGMCRDLSSSSLVHELQMLYQHSGRQMSDQMLMDILAIAKRNLAYLGKLRTCTLQSDSMVDRRKHGGWVLNVGRGSGDWLRKYQTALVIDSFDPKFSQKVKIAATILTENIQSPGFNRDRGLVLLASAPFRPSDLTSIRRAECNALKWADVAMEAIQDMKELQSYLSCLVVIVNMETRLARIL